MLCVVRHCSRGLAILAVALGMVGLAAAPARASCIQQTQADQMARADVIAYGRIIGVDRAGGSLSFRALTVYKGDPGPGTLAVRVGPGGGAATSVDYRADPGDHLLYLQRDRSTYATNDCSGSHPGPATTDELRLLATGKVISYTDPGPQPLDQIGGLAVGLVGLGALLALALVIGSRRARRANVPPAPPH